MNQRLVAWAVLGVGCAAALLGCSKSPAPPIPDQTTARQALEAALNAWQKGQASPGKLTFGDAVVEVRDAIWNSGQKLKAYDIGSEDLQGIAHWFTVKLTLGRGEQTAKYAVVGTAPVRVYTEEEFRNLSAWGDDPLNPPASPPARRGRSSGGR